MQRRQFLGAVTAPTFSIAPKWRIIGPESKYCKTPPFQSSSPIVEVRRYDGMNSAGARVLALLKKHSIETVQKKELTFVSSFESAAQRGEAWNRLSADEAWHLIRKQAKLQLTSLVIYERLSGSDGDSSAA